jgi:putative transposase
MARPLRIEYPGALYHIASRGNVRNRIYGSDKDRIYSFELFGEVDK